jgi:hypothetical protein
MNSNRTRYNETINRGTVINIHVLIEKPHPLDNATKRNIKIKPGHALGRMNLEIR